MADPSVSELKDRVLSHFVEFSKVFHQRFSERTLVKRESDGRMEFRCRLDVTKFKTKMDNVPFYDPRIIALYQYDAMIHLSTRPKQPSSQMNQSMNNTTNIQDNRIQKRKKEGPTSAVRSYEMTWHSPRAVSQIPTAVSMCYLGMTGVRKHLMLFQVCFFLNDFDDDCGPLVTMRVSAAPVRGTKRQSLMKDERISERKTQQDLLTELARFHQADPILCGVDSPDQVMIGVIEGDKCEWCMNLWNGLYQHPFMTGSGDHLGSAELTELSLQFVTQLFKRARSLINEDMVDKLNLYAWQNSPVFFRYQKNDFIRYIRLGKGQVTLTGIKVRNSLECEVSLEISQSNMVCYTADLIVSPVFQFSSNL